MATQNNLSPLFAVILGLIKQENKKKYNFTLFSLPFAHLYYSILPLFHFFFFLPFIPVFEFGNTVNAMNCYKKFFYVVVTHFLYLYLSYLGLYTESVVEKLFGSMKAEPKKESNIETKIESKGRVEFDLGNLLSLFVKIVHRSVLLKFKATFFLYLDER